MNEIKPKNAGAYVWTQAEQQKLIEDARRVVENYVAEPKAMVSTIEQFDAFSTALGLLTEASIVTRVWCDVETRSIHFNLADKGDE